MTYRPVLFPHCCLEPAFLVPFARFGLGHTYKKKERNAFSSILVGVSVWGTAVTATALQKTCMKINYKGRSFNLFPGPLEDKLERVWPLHSLLLVAFSAIT